MHEILSKRYVGSSDHHVMTPPRTDNPRMPVEDKNRQNRIHFAKRSSPDLAAGTEPSIQEPEPVALSGPEAPHFEIHLGHRERSAAIPRADQQDTADVLHVGCGVYTREKLPPVFRQTGWREIRLDIDPEVHPDFVASITDMWVISDGSVDAVYSSHNIEHLYPHEVPLALREMHRVLSPPGFAFIKLPDLQEVARHVAEGKLEDPLYLSPMGPIAPLDVLYGHRPSLARGNAFMAHRTGFTGDTLGAALVKAGFAAVMVQRDPPAFCLEAVAFRNMPGEEQLVRAQAGMLPAPDRPAVLYTPAR